jgi:hypothetical protein
MIINSKIHIIIFGHAKVLDIHNSLNTIKTSQPEPHLSEMIIT